MDLLKIHMCLVDYVGEGEVEKVFTHNNKEIQDAAEAQRKAFKGVKGVPPFIVKEGG